MSRKHSDSPHPHRTPPLPESGVRLRSVPYRSPYVWAEIFALFNFCCAIAILTVIPIFFFDPAAETMKLLIACVVLYALTGFISFLKRRHVLCPLCKGTPLVSSRAHVHQKATRIFPLDYGTSATLILLFTQTFRCMFCGARFDLLKERSVTKSSQEPARQDSLS